MMAAHHIHSVVVKADAELPRIVTDIDIAAAMYDESLERSTALELSHPAVLVRSDDTITYALERLHECAESHAVVAGPGLRLLGVVSVLDLAEWSLREADAPATAPFHG
jgi:CBS domain-containing protein